MGKKKKLGAPREAYNPYYGKFKDESHMAKKPFFTWIFVIPGVVIGLLVQNVGLGVIFGAIMGIAIGTLLDKRLEKRKEEREGRE